MSTIGHGMQDVDLLMQNAELRTELERFVDESMQILEQAGMPTGVENEYLESLLAWERAPTLPISKWFEPELVLPPHKSLSDAELSQLLHWTIERLYEQQIVLECTDHLSDRQLYSLISRAILPEHEKQLSIPGNYLRWQCIDPVVDEENWLRFYADAEERIEWQLSTGLRLPPRGFPPFPRDLPGN